MLQPELRLLTELTLSTSNVGALVADTDLDVDLLSRITNLGDGELLKPITRAQTYLDTDYKKMEIPAL